MEVEVKALCACCMVESTVTPQILNSGIDGNLGYATILIPNDEGPGLLIQVNMALSTIPSSAKTQDAESAAS